jgi:thiosulfate/3-mercaptopyruvate sulfurtransferase
MAHTTLIEADALHLLLRQPHAAVRVFDCGFDLADPAAGERAFEAAHLPGAAYLHLDSDLSGVKTGTNGRHPLPARESLEQRMVLLGVDDACQVVAYDSAGGMFAARLWWLLRWVGHDAVAVLNGGLSAWRAAGFEVEGGAAATRPPGRFSLRPPRAGVVDHAALRENLRSGRQLVVDARSPERFRGENETLDAVGGHIPGAVNRFFKYNLQADGRFKPAAQLKAEFEALGGGRAPDLLVQQCGSGVTACHNLLALEVAGLGGSPLYPGSWSEWCLQPGAPVARGDA